jgi:hypothetical protein
MEDTKSFGVGGGGEAVHPGLVVPLNNHYKKSWRRMFLRLIRAFASAMCT